jgi:hypothetical protein
MCCTPVGVEVSVDNLASNLKFSWPTYKSGLRVLIAAHLQQGSTWAFSEVRDIVRVLLLVTQYEL